VQGTYGTSSSIRECNPKASVDKLPLGYSTRLSQGVADVRIVSHIGAGACSEGIPIYTDKAQVLDCYFLPQEQVAEEHHSLGSSSATRSALCPSVVSLREAAEHSTVNPGINPGLTSHNPACPWGTSRLPQTAAS
jgi:hypothetical protein